MAVAFPSFEGGGYDSSPFSDSLVLRSFVHLWMGGIFRLRLRTLLRPPSDRHASVQAVRHGRRRLSRPIRVWKNDAPPFFWRKPVISDRQQFCKLPFILLQFVTVCVHYSWYEIFFFLYLISLDLICSPHSCLWMNTCRVVQRSW